MAESTIARAYDMLENVPLGRRILSLGISLRAPYFLTIRPRLVSLAPGHGVATIADRWRVHNHIGTVHAIACCNLAEFIGASTVDVSLPPSHRWIPKGMTVSYLAKAAGELRGVATVEPLDDLGADESRDVVVGVDILDRAGVIVVRADITMWVSPDGKSGALTAE